MSASTLVVVPNDFLFRSSPKSSSFVTNLYPTSFSLSLPAAPPFTQRPYFRIFSLSTQPQPQGKSPPPPTTTTTSTRKPVAVYLIERLGFSEEQSLSISKRLLRRRDRSAAKHVQVSDLISFEKADYVITYLQDENECGLDLSKIKSAIRKHPRVLAADVDKTLRPKVKLLQHLGFSTSDLALVLSTNPRLYLESDLGPAIQQLRGIMGSDEGVVRVFKGLKRHTAPNITKSLLPNVTMLENEYGVPRDKIRKFLAKGPIIMVSRTDWLREVLVRVEHKWGITRDSAQFLRAVHAFSGFTDENMDSKCQVFRSYGWSDSDILSLIRRLPSCLGLSEAGIKNKLDFYMKELGYDPAYMASRPTLFSYSLENRVLPRHRVLVILKEKRLIKADYQLISYLGRTVDKFFNTFVLPYEKLLPNLRDVYINRRAPCEVPLLAEAYENGS